MEIIHSIPVSVNVCENKIHKKVDIIIDNINILVYNKHK